MADHAALLTPLIDIARRASAAIMQVYESEDLGVQNKADDSPLTRADLASHQVIVDGLRKLTPDWPILSEESADISWETRRSWKRYWLVDPLDGTKEFIKRNGEFTVNIALIEENKVNIGIVLAPVLKTVWYAAATHGAYRARIEDLSRPIDNHQSLSRQAIKIRKIESTPVIVASRSHVTERLQNYLEQLPRHERLACGSSLKFCRVAEGSADLYPRLGLTSEWDTAAAQCVVEQAGGKVTKPDGTALDYNNKENILNPEFLVIGDTSFQWPAIDVETA